MNYASLASTADRLIGSAGRVVTFSRYSPVVDEMGGTVDRGTPTTCTANAIVLPASKGTVDAFDNRLDALILDKRILRYLKVAALNMTFEPMPLDEVTMDGATWQVLGCTPINPAGTALVYGVGLVQL